MSAVGLTWSGRFIDPEKERAYRSGRLAHDRSLARLLVLSILVLDLAFVPMDFHSLGLTPGLVKTLLLRLSGVVFSIVCFHWLGQVQSAAGFEGILSVWVVILLVQNMLTYLISPDENLESASAYTVAVFVAYYLPVRLELQICFGLLITITYLSMLSISGWPGDVVQTSISTVIGFAAANVFGGLVGRRNQIVHRLEYSATVALARAAQEIQTLEGLLPICAHCKKIKDEVGQWQVLETYFKARMAARFSHGICPNCLVSEYGMEHPSITQP